MLSLCFSSIYQPGFISPGLSLNWSISPVLMCVLKYTLRNIFQMLFHSDPKQIFMYLVYLVQLLFLATRRRVPAHLLPAQSEASNSNN